MGLVPTYALAQGFSSDTGFYLLAVYNGYVIPLFFCLVIANTSQCGGCWSGTFRNGIRSFWTLQYDVSNDDHYYDFHLPSLVPIWESPWCDVLFRCPNGTRHRNYPLLASCLSQPDVQDRGSWTLVGKLLSCYQPWVSLI